MYHIIDGNKKPRRIQEAPHKNSLPPPQRWKSLETQLPIYVGGIFAEPWINGIYAALLLTIWLIERIRSPAENYVHHLERGTIPHSGRRPCTTHTSPASILSIMYSCAHVGWRNSLDAQRMTWNSNNVSFNNVHVSLASRCGPSFHRESRGIISG